jgi:hypothetical protein
MNVYTSYPWPASMQWAHSRTCSFVSAGAGVRYDGWIPEMAIPLEVRLAA